jgi:CHASE1-domain containing sensor protein
MTDRINADAPASAGTCESTRLVYDLYAYEERLSIMLDSGAPQQQAESESLESALMLPYSIAATQYANCDPTAAKAMCRREMQLHGRTWAMELWNSITGEQT